MLKENLFEKSVGPYLSKNLTNGSTNKSVVKKSFNNLELD
jgi:hypothetical protein